MSQETFFEIAYQSISVMIALAGPLMIIGLIVGMSVSLLQAITQIQEPALTFVPKIAVTTIALLLLAPTMVQELQAFFSFIIDKMVNLE